MTALLESTTPQERLSHLPEAFPAFQHLAVLRIMALSRFLTQGTTARGRRTEHMSSVMLARLRQIIFQGMHMVIFSRSSSPSEDNE